MSSHRFALGLCERGWIAFTVPPAVWMAQLLLMYLLVPVACERGTRAPLLVVTGVALAAAAVAVAAGRRGDRRGGDGADREGIAAVGRIQGGVFLLAILGAGAAALWIDPCA